MKQLRGVMPLMIFLILGVMALAPYAGGREADNQDSEEGILRLHLMWTNDVHGHIAPEGAKFMNPDFPPPLGGGASAANYIKEVRAKAAAAGEEVLLVDVGDMFQGTPIGNKTQGEAVIKYFNAIGYDFAVPGNHDFDKGRDNTERLARMSEFPCWSWSFLWFRQWPYCRMMIQPMTVPCACTCCGPTMCMATSRPKGPNS